MPSRQIFRGQHAGAAPGERSRIADIHNRFGERVAKIVEACSDSLAGTSAGEGKAPYETIPDVATWRCYVVRSP